VTEDKPREPERLPIEDLDEGLYLHPGSVELLKFTVGEEEPQYYVGARDFMEMQKQRDDYRKACAMINAWRVEMPDGLAGRLRFVKDILAKVGMDDKDGEAMVGIIREFSTKRIGERLAGIFGEEKPDGG
jgi:hypothetical protein